MLILCRNESERLRVRVVVDGKPVDTWVSLVWASKGKVALGFDAPPCVEIAREELLKDEGNKAA